MGDEVWHRVGDVRVRGESKHAVRISSLLPAIASGKSPEGGFPTWRFFHLGNLRLEIDTRFPSRWRSRCESPPPATLMSCNTGRGHRRSGGLIPDMSYLLCSPGPSLGPSL